MVALLRQEPSDRQASRTCAENGDPLSARLHLNYSQQRWEIGLAHCAADARRVLLLCLMNREVSRKSLD